MQGEDVGQNVCDIGDAEWPDPGPQESEFKPEELKRNTSVHLYSDLNPTESQSSPQTLLNTANSEEQQIIHTPLMMCSVRLVDCKTIENRTENHIGGVNINITQEEHLSDGSVHAEEPGEPVDPEELEELKADLDEPDEGSDDFCPEGKSSSVVLLFTQR